MQTATLPPSSQSLAWKGAWTILPHISRQNPQVFIGATVTRKKLTDLSVYKSRLKQISCCTVLPVSIVCLCLHLIKSVYYDIVTLAANTIEITVLGLRDHEYV
jgi:hypothetical protein